MNGHAATAPGRPLRARATHGEAERGPLGALAVAGLCVLAMAAVWCVAELVPAAHLRDAIALEHFTSLSRPGLDSLGMSVLRLLSPGPFVLWGVALVAVALAREQPRVAIAVAVVLALAPFSADVLKPLLAHSHDHVGSGLVPNAASWPSGHAAAATVLAMCCVLVSPPRLRAPVAVLGAVFVAAVSFSLLVMAWHMPSDVIGGVLLATLWMALAVAALRGAERLWPSRADGATDETAHARDASAPS